MGKMKEVYMLKQEMIQRNSFLKDMPDKFFIDAYLYNLGKLKELQNEIESYNSNQPLPEDNYNHDPYGDGTPNVN
jgi:hypothetical protein